MGASARWLRWRPALTRRPALFRPLGLQVRISLLVASGLLALFAVPVADGAARGPGPLPEMRADGPPEAGGGLRGPGTQGADCSGGGAGGSSRAAAGARRAGARAGPGARTAAGRTGRGRTVAGRTPRRATTFAMTKARMTQ